MHSLCPPDADALCAGSRQAPTTTSVLPSDTIDFVEESQIEVTESPLSDTMIQRIFKSFIAA
jgi:hypothetical protein